MSGWAIEVRVPPGSRAATAVRLVEWTDVAVEERPDGTLVSFAPTAAETETLLARLKEAVPSGLQTTCTHIETTDWLLRWRDGLAPRQIGRLTIVPSWLHPDTSPPERTVILDPGGAFGSGEHGSTRAALGLLERLVPPGAVVLDLGSGSGILAIAALAIGARQAIGIDVDEQAVEVAEANARRNGVAHAVSFLTGDARMLVPLLGPVDCVVANILRTVNTALLPIIHGSLRADGVAVFSGMEEEEAAEFLAALADARFDVVEQRTDDGWWAVAAKPR
ncbi:MAG: methyltransferase domain-containing protein [Gemmatimonadales bacterium]|nr:MAG: methyltransferase domain-containing protein [Gemmatimonadales bacterium]